MTAGPVSAEPASDGPASAGPVSAEPVGAEPGGAAGPGVPAPLTPAPSESAPAALRFADFLLSADGQEVWCVQERHEGGKITRSLVAVPLDGSAAENPEAIRELVSGPDFFAFPTLSPDGSSLAWICWNHPRMPWDGTELRVARFLAGYWGAGGWLRAG